MAQIPNKKQATSSKKELKNKPLKKNPANKYLNYLAIAFIIAITYASFSSSLKNDFTNWDDNGYVIDNALVKSLSFDNIKAIFSTYVMGNYHPLAIFSLAIDYHFHELNAPGYHLSSLFFHLINVILVFAFVQLLTRQTLISFVTALLFGIHPMHVESVAWVAERKDLLYLLFYMASLCMYLLFLQKEKNKGVFYIFTLLLFTFSLMSKGQGVTFPVILLLVDFYKNREFNKSLILEKIPFFLLSLAFGIIAVMAQHSSNAIHDIKNYAFLDRILFACYAFMTYCWKFIVPLNLSAFHPYPVKTGNFYAPLLYIVPLLVLALIYFIVRYYKTYRNAAFGIAFFCVNIFLLLQLLPVGNAVISERYSYLAFIGIYFSVGSGIYAIRNSTDHKVLKYKDVATVLLGIFIVFLIYTNHERNKIWKNSESLWTNVIHQYPDVPIAYNNLGSYYQKQVKLDLALTNFNRAIQLTPDYPEALINRSDIFRVKGSNDLAIADCNKAIEVNNNYSGAYMNRGIAYCIVGKYDAAFSDFNRVLSTDPKNINAYCNRGNLFSMKGKLDSAMADYNMALSLNPNYPSAFANRGKCYVDLKKYKEAINDLTLAVKIDPKNAEAFFMRSTAYKGTGNYFEAYQDALKSKELGKVVDQAFLVEIKNLQDSKNIKD